MRAALIALLVIAFSGCSLHGPLPPTPAGSASGTAVPAGAGPAAVPGHPVPPSGRPARMGAAASALLAQARAGETVAAAATLERALRIEPDTPLLWVELGRVQLAQGNAAQADSMGRKALALAAGDGAAQAAAWTLIADSLRARGRDADAAQAAQHAAALVPH
jgi:hypothetical protein